MIVGSLIFSCFIFICLLKLATRSGCLWKKHEMQFFPFSSFSSHSLDCNRCNSLFQMFILRGNPRSSKWDIHRTIAFSCAGVRRCWYTGASMHLVLPLRTVVSGISYALAVRLTIGKSPSFCSFYCFLDARALLPWFLQCSLLNLPYVLYLYYASLATIA